MKFMSLKCNSVLSSVVNKMAFLLRRVGGIVKRKYGIKPIKQHVLRSFHGQRYKSRYVINGFYSSNVLSKLRMNSLFYNSSLYYTVKHSKKPKLMRKIFKYGIRSLMVLLVSGSVLFGGFYYNHRDEKNFKRSLEFWRRVYPIYFDYVYCDWKTKNYSQSDRDIEFEKLHEKYAPIIVDIIDDLRGLYIKLAQLCAANLGDMYPQTWIEACRKFEDQCPYETFDKIEKILNNEYQTDYKNIFSYVDPKPLGSASIGQTHYAILKDTGEKVVIKIQYPDAEELFRGDLLLTKKV